MKEFTIKYNMKLKSDNIELEFKVSNEDEFKKIKIGIHPIYFKCK